MTEQERIVPEITMSASEVRKHFSEVVNRVANGEDRVFVEKHGTPAVALVSFEDLRRLRRLDKVIRERSEFLEAFREPFKDIPDEELERELEKTFAEIREERRQKRAEALEAANDREEVGVGR